MLLVPLLLLMPLPLLAQSEADAPVVSYTLVVEHSLRPIVKLPGTVRARHRSIIGSEMGGTIVALHVREGQSVERGESLAQLRTDMLEQQFKAAQSGLDAIIARRQLTGRSLERTRELFQTNSMSEQQLDELAYELLGLRAEEQQLMAEIAEIALAIEHSHIRAPFDGVIVARHSDVGEFREEGDPIVEIISDRDLEVDVAVPEMYYDDLRGIRGAEVAFTSLSDRRYSLELSALVPEIVAGSRSLVVKLHIPDDLPELTVVDGMLADVWLAFADANAATMVPKDAVVQRQEKRLVLILDMHNQTRVVPVLTGKSSGPWVEVRGDVTAGERVIVRGNERLDGGLTVNATLLDYPSP
jgi:RND family efflux transporter MFP subunit